MDDRRSGSSFRRMMAQSQIFLFLFLLFLLFYGWCQRRRHPTRFRVNNTMLSPLMFLHGFFSVEFLVTNLALKWAIVSVSSFMNPQIALLSVMPSAYFT